MDITEVIKALTIAMNITEPLRPDERGHYRLFFDDGLPIDFSITRKGELIIAGELQKFSNNNPPKEDLLIKVLALSTQFLQREQECVSYDLDTNRIIMYRRLPRSEITQKNIIENLESLLNNMEIWVTTFSEQEKGFPTSPQSVFLTP